MSDYKQISDKSNKVTRKKEGQVFQNRHSKSSTAPRLMQLMMQKERHQDLVLFMKMHWGVKKLI